MFLDWTSCLATQSQIPTLTASMQVATLKCIPIVFNNVIGALLVFSGVVALFLIAWSAIRMIISGGDPKQVAAARQMMTYAIVGLIVVLISTALVLFIGYITKSTNCITDLTKITSGGCK